MAAINLISSSLLSVHFVSCSPYHTRLLGLHKRHPPQCLMHGEELLKNERGSGGGGLYREYTCVQIEEGRRGEGEKERRRDERNKKVDVPCEWVRKQVTER